jgi:hypothetical protein
MLFSNDNKDSLLHPKRPDACPPPDHVTLMNPVIHLTPDTAPMLKLL